MTAKAAVSLCSGFRECRHSSLNQGRVDCPPALFVALERGLGNWQPRPVNGGDGPLLISAPPTDHTTEKLLMFQSAVEGWRGAGDFWCRTGFR